MKKYNLGKIEKVDLRDIWETEDRDFTPWLAEEKNIFQLGDAIGIELEVESQEKSVGPFRADILARDTATNHYVLIENQLEATDHKHFGQIMTYAAGLDAFSIIWIARSFTEEHRAAVDWLNSITNENINFFGIEIEAIRIGDSVAAPQFKVVAKPNDWTRSVKKAASNNEPTKTQLKQLDYWTALKEYVDKNGTPFRMQKPLPQQWSNIALGRSGFQIIMSVNSQKKTVAVSLGIDTNSAEDNKKYFDVIKRDYEAMATAAISDKLSWQRLDDNKISIVQLSENYDFLDSATHDEQFAWFVDNVNKFIKFFRPKIKSL